MASTHLIDAIVRQTTVLIAALATAQGQRAPLAGMAEQVFADLVGELKRQGLGNKVIADMFGLALRTYHNQVARHSESRTSAGQSVSSAVLAFLQDNGTTSRAEVLARFRRDDAAVVRGVLKDLVDSAVLFRTGSGDRTAYRVARPNELLHDPVGRARGLSQLILVAVFQHGPLRAEELRQWVPGDAGAVVAALEALVEDERLHRDGEGDTAVYRCDALFVPFQDPDGWEAALLDHYQAMVAAMCVKLRDGQTHAELVDRTGGSTYTFDIWDGHPLEDEVLGLLERLRRQSMELWERVGRHNRDHARPAQAAPKRVIGYVGQSVRQEEDGDD
jgi:hypothetical protein